MSLMSFGFTLRSFRKLEINSSLLAISSFFTIRLNVFMLSARILPFLSNINPRVACIGLIFILFESDLTE